MVIGTFGKVGSIDDAAIVTGALWRSSFAGALHFYIEVFTSSVFSQQIQLYGMSVKIADNVLTACFQYFNFIILQNDTQEKLGGGNIVLKGLAHEEIVDKTQSRNGVEIFRLDKFVGHTFISFYFSILGLKIHRQQSSMMAK